ncbi:di-heme oxidoredictase family protein, partial [uncultured Agrobacterium sp.]|uniref:di-heme oxidoredictase family protein n=1 Tax=uncultured Agrobacterium sp. TaxID=157277 RepID=UPI0025F49C3A
MKHTDLIRFSSPALAIALCGIPSLAADLKRSDISGSDLARVLAVTRPASDFSKAEAFEAMSAGATTTTAASDTTSFSQPSANITLDQGQTFKLGHALFQKLWVSAPSSTQASDGLGPLYNARSCQTCHINDGRG